MSQLSSRKHRSVKLFSPQTKANFRSGSALRIEVEAKVCPQSICFSLKFPEHIIYLSSSTLSLLPASPKIFHGREAELNHVVSDLLRGDSARIAILGPGGVGKSSLALAAVHDQAVVSRFKTHRYFIPCDSAGSDADLLSIIATHFGLGQEGKPSKAVHRYLSMLSGPVMIILDNLESAWEAQSSRSQVEEFLSRLTEIKNLSVLVCLSFRSLHLQYSR